MKAAPLLLSSLVLAASLTAGSVQTGQPPAATPPSAFDTGIKDFKNPADWFTWGGDLRVRNEYLNNAVSLTAEDSLAEQDLFRFRARVWGTVTAAANFTFNFRATSEPRLWIRPSFVGVCKAQTGMEWRYGMADLLNIKWGRVLDLPLTLTLGRQDILMGDFYDWWLICDGTPGDGSSTTYLDAARATYMADALKTRFDLIYIYQSPLPGAWMPTIGDSEQYPLTDQREEGLVLHASNKSIENTQLDGYFIYKHDDRETFTIAGANKTPGDNARTYTVGGKITGTPAEHWLYSLEGACQFGRKEDRISGVNATRDLAAYGGKAKLAYVFKDRMHHQISLARELLSGDDPKTGGTDEMFDVLWGRWPRWSELYIYSYVYEAGGRIAQMGNLGRVGPMWSLNPTKPMTVSLAYNALFAPEKIPSRSVANGRFNMDGRFRGHFVQAFLKIQFNPHLAGHVWGEAVWEGDYYAQRDVMTFVRAELTYSF